LFFLFKVSLVFLLEVHADLVVDEGEYHTVVKGNQVRGFVLVHLSVALHENESTVTGKLIFALLAD